jgi:hypothetical protein
VKQLKHKGFIYNALNCLNKENKRFSNSFFLSLYLIFFSSSLTFFFFFFSCFMPIIATRGVLDVSLLVRQLKHKSFICNALKCLNEENKNFSNSLFLPLYLIFFSLFGMHLIDILMKKTKSSLYLIFFLSSLTLCLYLNVRQLNHMCFICNIFKGKVHLTPSNYHPNDNLPPKLLITTIYPHKLPKQ